MLLAIDIGNSNISVGLFDKAGKLLFLSSIDTDSRKTADQISIDLMNLFAGNAGTGHFLSDIEQKPGA